MNTVDIAMITYGSADFIVALLPSDFDQHSAEEKNNVLHAIQCSARSAKIHGRLIAVWEDGSGNRKTLSGPDVNPLCYLLSMRWVRRNLCSRLEI